MSTMKQSNPSDWNVDDNRVLTIDKVKGGLILKNTPLVGRAIITRKPHRRGAKINP